MDYHVLAKVATCPMEPDSTSLLRRAPALPRVPQLWNSPSCLGGLYCYHVSHGSIPYLPTQEIFGAAMCPKAPDPTSLLRRATALPCVLRPSEGRCP
jgi:hypothetical protein